MKYFIFFIFYFFFIFIFIYFLFIYLVIYVLRKLLSLVFNWLTFLASAMDSGKLLHSRTMKKGQSLFNSPVNETTKISNQNCD